MTVRNRILRRLVSSAGVAAMLLAAPVYAQTTDGNGGDDQGTGIGDIIVTANKRSENLQKTPAAITALSGDQMVARGITTITAAQEVVPNARFQQQGNTVLIATEI